MRGRLASLWVTLAILAPAAGGELQAASSPSGELRGVVLGSDSRPIEGCRATLGEISALSDAQGLFRLSGVPALEHESSLVLEAPAHAVKRVRLPELPRSSAFDLGTFALSSGIDVRGVIRGPEGAPRAGARVFLVTRAGHEESRTGPGGRFRFARVDPGRYDLVLAAAGLPIAVRRGVELDRSSVLEPLRLERGIAVTGRIVSPEGQPAPAGTILAVTYDSSLPRLSPTLPGLGPRALIGADGRFRLTGLRAGSEVLLRGRSGEVTTHSLQLLSIPETPAGEATVELGELVVPPRVSVAGRVIDPAGRPIPGARVIPRHKGIGGYAGVQLVVESGPTGDFRLPPLVARETLLHVSALGYRSRDGVEIPPAAIERAMDDPSSLEIVLQPIPSGSLEVVVRPRAGSEVPAGAEVRLEGLSGAAETAHDRLPLDGAGRARWERLPAGSYLLSVVGERHARLHRERLEVREGATELVIELPEPEPAAEVTGRVEGPGSEPVAFASLWLWPADRRGPALSALSDGRGRWQAKIPPGAYRLTVEHPEHVPLVLSEVTVTTGTRALGPFKLERGLELGGLVPRLTQSEAARLEVTAASEERHVTGEIGPDGRFRIGRLTAGDWSIQARISGTPLVARTSVSLRAGGAPPRVELAFPPTLTVTGRVTDRGAPLAGAYVRASPALDVPGQDATAATDAGGRFRLSGLSPGPYDLRVSVRPVGRIDRRRIVLPDDAEVEIALATGRVEGRVVRADDGAGIPSVSVRFVPVGHDRPDEDGLVRTTTHERFTGIETDADGRFTVEPLEEGLWRLEASAAGFAPGTAELLIADGNSVEDLAIELVPTPGLELSVSTELGAVAYGVHARLENGEGEVVAERVIGEHEAGRSWWRDAPPGEWSLTVHSQVMGTRATLPVAIPGPPVEVILPSVGKLHLVVNALLEDGAKAELTLLDAAGNPAEAGGRHRRRAGRWPISSNRRFYVWGVEPGFYQARVEAEDGRSWSRWVAIDADVITEITLD